ncbi:carboxylesterase/lipase family protein [Novosphingobium pentaromativorans]|uniref:Carboxylic ester hydrolase n=1 Tax=Novosphingobium pentaromativorans US6-1 TaxID=1088721 RepID=G6EG77_9SPHN|nr:carboxylesterase family protein [Novosphingobium pentaromativorans]AIT82235.1 carboxylesterase [Novosphingobium pentaromativorans US6-1]EHJ59766.1 Carboxylesterase, type B [Novosphingobium pentaromativorans US6-1]
MIRFALSLLLAIGAPLAAVQAEPVKVEGGLIEGRSLASGVDAWLGVPFAAPPLRELRWQPPQPVTPWQGVFHADRYAPECLQPLRSPRQNHYFGNEATSEDCLYLNIWAPKGERNKLPVVVWIYGGGFNIGSASMANYSGEPLAEAGVIRVNVAYRVGPLGFLAHPELSRESGYNGSGNYGLMDQIAALQWVKRNIAGFGGDPDNVTIVGQSAGSMSVALLQASPLAKGLFQRVVGMSGSPFGGMLGPVPLDNAEAQGLALQKELDATSLADMRAIPGDVLTAAKTPRSPIVLDGHVLTGTAEETFAARRQNDVPLLIGFTRDESFLPFGPITTVSELTDAVRARYPRNADRILAAYPGSDPARRAADIARDATLGLQMAQWANAQSTYGSAPAYAYLFTRRQPYAPGITFSDHDPATVGAYHSGDVPYWLRTRDSLNLFRQTRIWEPGDVNLETEMSDALLAFARTGVPASPALGRWPAFSPSHPRMVRLGLETEIIDWPHYAALPLLSDPAVQARTGGSRPRD